jgi:hypothetical protein
MRSDEHRLAGAIHAFGVCTLGVCGIELEADPERDAVVQVVALTGPLLVDRIAGRIMRIVR